MAETVAKNVVVGLYADELDLMHRVMAHYRCSQAAAIRMLMRNGAPHTLAPLPPSPPQQGELTP